jgi:hypothetical protein
MRFKACLACAIAGSIPLSSTFGAITITSASRTISATASNDFRGGGGLTDTTTLLGPYSNTLQQSVQTINEPPGVMQTAFASQTSDISDTRFDVSGFVSGVDNAVSSGSGYSVGSSSLTITFAVNSPQSFSYLGTLSGSGGGNATVAGVSLINLANNSNALGGFDAGRSYSGLLPSGHYRFWLAYQAGHSSSGTGGGSITFNATFAIPSPSSAVPIGLVAMLASRRRR